MNIEELRVKILFKWDIKIKVIWIGLVLGIGVDVFWIVVFIE